MDIFCVPVTTDSVFQRFYTIFDISDTDIAMFTFSKINPPPEEIGTLLYSSQEEADAAIADLRNSYPQKYFTAEQLGAQNGSYWCFRGRLIFNPKTAVSGHEEKRGIQLWHVPLLPDASFGQPYNRLAVYQAAKDNVSSAMQRDMRGVLATVFLPSETTPMSESTILLTPSSYYGYRCNRDAPVVDGPSFQYPWPTISFIAENNELPTDSMMEVRVQTNDASGNPIATEVYLETTAGYISHKRVVTNENGYGIFRFRSMDLLSGEAVRIKGGWRNFPGVTDLNITITD